VEERTLLLRKGTGGKGKEGKGMVLLLREGKEERGRKGERA